MKNKLKTRPAYPLEYSTFEGMTPNKTRVYHYETGMSKRFYAACVAMQGMLASHANLNSSHPMHSSDEDIEKAIKTCYKYADELLKQE